MISVGPNEQGSGKTNRYLIYSLIVGTQDRDEAAAVIGTGWAASREGCCRTNSKLWTGSGTEQLTLHLKLIEV